MSTDSDSTVSVQSPMGRFLCFTEQFFRQDDLIFILPEMSLWNTAIYLDFSLPKALRSGILSGSDGIGADVPGLKHGKQPRRRPSSIADGYCRGQMACDIADTLSILHRLLPPP